MAKKFVTKIDMPLHTAMDTQDNVLGLVPKGTLLTEASDHYTTGAVSIGNGVSVTVSIAANNADAVLVLVDEVNDSESEG